MTKPGVIFSEGVLTHNNQPLEGIPQLFETIHTNGSLIGVISPRGSFPNTNVGKTVKQAEADAVVFEPVRNIKELRVRSMAWMALWGFVLDRMAEKGADPQQILAVIAGQHEEIGPKHAREYSFAVGGNSGNAITGGERNEARSDIPYLNIGIKNRAEAHLLERVGQLIVPHRSQR